MSTKSKPTGVRERNKQEKLDRIIKAARAVFIEKGYSQATIRQISSQAGVAFGTVFLYASDKRDLLFLIYNDDLEKLADDAFLNVDPDAAFVDQLLTIFREFYQFFFERPELARDVLREMNFYEQGSQAIRFSASIRRIEDNMETVVSRCLERGIIRSEANSHSVAVLLFGIYRTEVRRWLSRRDIDIDHGLTRLMPYLEIVVNGLKPR